jgi:hypothetical protein
VKAKVRPSVIGMFCEDIRLEKDNPAMLIGIFPDNITVAHTPGMMPKLAVYVRGRFPVDKPPAAFQLRIEFPWDQPPVALGTLEPAKIAHEINASKDAGGDAIGFISSAIFAPFNVQKPGRVRAIVSTGKEEWIAASLNFVLGESPAPPVAAPSEAIQPRRKTAKKAKSRKP